MSEEKLRGFQTVRVSKDTLVSKLTENRSKHIAEYDQAVADWKVAVVAAYQEALDKANADEEYIQSVFVPKPVSYEDSYNRILSLLDNSMDGEFELPFTEFVQYVLDQWTWKESFSNTTANYSSIAGANKVR